jgi:hypothetical protein
MALKGSFECSQEIENQKCFFEAYDVPKLNKLLKIIYWIVY